MPTNQPWNTDDVHGIFVASIPWLDDQQWHSRRLAWLDGPKSCSATAFWRRLDWRRRWDGPRCFGGWYAPWDGGCSPHTRSTSQCRRSVRLFLTIWSSDLNILGIVRRCHCIHPPRRRALWCQEGNCHVSKNFSARSSYILRFISFCWSTVYSDQRDSPQPITLHLPVVHTTSSPFRLSRCVSRNCKPSRDRGFGRISTYTGREFEWWPRNALCTGKWGEKDQGGWSRRLAVVWNNGKCCHQNMGFSTVNTTMCRGIRVIRHITRIFLSIHYYKYPC